MKITNPLKGAEMPLKRSLLNKSNSYTFYKKEHDRLTKELENYAKREKKLINELKDCKNELEKSKRNCHLNLKS